MSLDLILELTPFGARAALMRHGELVETRFADNDASDMRGQIFLARVNSLDHELDAAFIDCGRGLTAYLSGRDGRYVGGRRSDQQLHRQLTEGQSVVVQGTGRRAEGKKPRVTSDIQLSGMYQIYRPKRRSVKLSNKLSETGQSTRLFALAKSLYPEGGVVFRGAAALAGDDELEAESQFLTKLWQDIQTKADTGRAPASLFERGSPLDRVLHEALRPDIERIIAADNVVLASVRRSLEGWLPTMMTRLECQPGAFEANGVNEQLERAQEPRIELDGGGSIVIEQTEALTAIDVNSGGRRALDANLDAAKEIARQVRLQRIGGIIVVDFINLTSQSERDSLISALDEAFADDPAAVTLYPPTPLGLVQISRQRLGQSLADRLQRPCPTCHGGGRATSLRASLERMLGELNQGAGGRPKNVRLAVDLYGYLAAEAAEPFRDFIERHGLVPPSLKPDETLPPGTYRMGRP